MSLTLQGSIPESSAELASAAVAYATEGLVCDMWKVFGAKARAAGYVPYARTKCSGPVGKARKRGVRADSRDEE